MSCWMTRAIISGASSWDPPLPQEKQSELVTWRHSLQDLRQLQIPHPYSPDALSKASNLELYLSLDAFTKDIQAVAYFRVTDKVGTSNVSFVLRKASSV